ncbi:MAG: tetratricopeptide repeat protein [Bacteroidota bacterium]|nr:tetratricopeptide repeat protein [Bacteroidota bacterium]
MKKGPAYFSTGGIPANAARVVHHRHVLSLVCILCLPVFAFAQERPESPVFRDYRPVRYQGLPQNPDPVKQWRDIELIRAANQGDAVAQHELGMRYLLGDGFPADTGKAAYWISKAADGRLVYAEYNYGLMLLNGWGAEWNPFEAFRRIKSAATRGMLEARHLLGMLYTEDLIVPRDWVEAERWIRSAADSGYRASKEVVDDISRRAERQRREAAQARKKSLGNERSSSPGKNAGWTPVLLDFDPDTLAPPPGVGDLALAAIISAGLSREDSLALLEALGGRLTMTVMPPRLDSAAAFGNPEAVLLVAWCRLAGFLGEPDTLKAAEGFIRGVYLDAPQALSLLRVLASSAAFHRLLRERVVHADPLAQFVQAELVAIGFDASVAERQALDFLLSSVRGGSVRATAHLALRKQSGRWVERDVDGALALWDEAAERGDAESAVRAAAYRVFSSKTGADLRRSIAVLGAADAYGSLPARVALAFCYEHGVGVPVDHGRAARLYRSAAYRGSRNAYEALKRMHDRIRPPDEEFRL